MLGGERGKKIEAFSEASVQVTAVLVFFFAHFFLFRMLFWKNK